MKRADDLAPRATAAKVQLGELLIDQGVLTEAQLKEALEHQKEKGHNKLLGEVLIELSFASEEQIIESLATCYGVPFARLSPRIADPRVTEALPRDFIEQHCVLPLFLIDGVLTVAVTEPANLFLIEEIERVSGHRAQIVVSTAKDIRSTLQSHLPSANVFVIDEIYDDAQVGDFSVVEQEMQDLGNLEEVSGQSPVIKLVNFIIYQAVQDRASDIHIEPDDHASRVRLRVDGRLVVKLNPPYQMHPAVVSRIKIMSGLDIAERRVPQDGDIHVMIDGRPIDLRVSTMPGKFGEKVVIRVIDNRSAIVPLDRVGFGPNLLPAWRSVISSPNGVILVTGPTGSGKSTTLYSVLAELASDEFNISTVENPVEVNLSGVNQFQINPKAGFTFAGALRALLRQDPDILMVGEIRDAETAQIATQAALTGHLVFSTLHTNDAISAVTRLVNMGVEPYLVAAILRGVLAQRLVRKICPHCKAEITPDDRTRTIVESVSGECPTLYRGEGCSRCHGKGYAGRLGVFELLTPSDELLEAVAQGQEMRALRAIAEKSGFHTLMHDGVEKAALGMTTVEEVLRVSSM
jgi:type IV pilus assembly protein PilB